MSRAFLVLPAICVVACASAVLEADRDGGGQVAPPAVDGGSFPGALGDLSTGCQPGQITCADPTHRGVCVAGAWSVQPCPSDTLCSGGACAAGCQDECVLDETRTVQGKTERCTLFSLAKNGPVPVTNGTHDRARRYEAWIRRYHLPEGALNSAVFTDTSYSQVATYHGMRDSALFTGAYLAAEALRCKATGSPDAQKTTRALVETIHRLFEVTGQAGVMARYAAPLGGDPRVAALYDPKDPEHHKVLYKGKDYFWDGNASRDAHQGPLLGYGLAYEVLTSENHRQMIRQDIVGLCMELIKERKQLTVDVRFTLGGQAFKLPLKLDLQYVVLNPAEFVDGHPAIQIGSDSDPSDVGESSVLGMREFFPDYSVVVKQVPLLGPVAGGVPIIRSGSTIMLASILRLGMVVTAGVPQYAAQNAAITAHYKQHIGEWVQKMKLYTFTTTTCWEKYYGLNITFMPMFNLIRMERDPTLRATLQGLLETKMWPYVAQHKNAFFNLMYASHAGGGPAVQAAVAAANAQIALFPPPPNAERQIDNTGKYPQSSACTNQTTVAVDVPDRKAAYFLWERHPFYSTQAGTPQLVFPGADYLIVYWLGRAGGVTPDDARGTCLRWQP